MEMTRFWQFLDPFILFLNPEIVCCTYIQKKMSLNNFKLLGRFKIAWEKKSYRKKSSIRISTGQVFHNYSKNKLGL